MDKKTTAPPEKKLRQASAHLAKRKSRFKRKELQNPKNNLKKLDYFIFAEEFKTKKIGAELNYITVVIN